MERSGRDLFDAVLGRAWSLEPAFAVERSVLDRIAASTGPSAAASGRSGLIEAIATLVDGLSGGLRPAFRSGSTAPHGVRREVYEAAGVRLALQIEPSTPGLPAGLASTYTITGRITGGAVAAGTLVRCQSMGETIESAVDEHGFFDVRVPGGGVGGVVRLEVRVGSTLVVVPALEVGPAGER